MGDGLDEHARYSVCPRGAAVRAGGGTRRAESGRSASLRQLARIRRPQRRLVPQEVTAAAKLGEGRQKASPLPAYLPRAEEATAMARSRGVFFGARSSCTAPPPLPSSEGQQRPVGTSE